MTQADTDLIAAVFEHSSPQKCTDTRPPNHECKHHHTDRRRARRAIPLRHEVRFLFAQSLPSAVVLAAEAQGIRQISYRQENMGGAMADGYARLSGKVGVVVAAQNGPAAALLVAPLAEALKASIPVVALVQEVERNQTDRNAFQELDHVALFQSCTKWVRRVQVGEQIETLCGRRLHRSDIRSTGARRAAFAGRSPA